MWKSLKPKVLPKLGLGSLLLLLSAAVPAPHAIAQDEATACQSATLALIDQVPRDALIGSYHGEDVMIPVRDGKKLHAQIWRPRDQEGDLPILVSRSPYGFTPEHVRGLLNQSYRELAEDGFIFVLQDIRGRLGSEGEFVSLRPISSSPEGFDEATDTFDTIGWLVENLPANNGKVGILGVSYGGWTAAMATVNPHPALKAVSSQASPNDMFIGDDFYHNGAFRLDYAWSWVSLLETDGRTMKPFDFGESHVYDWYLEQDELATMDHRHLGKAAPSWRDFVNHPAYDAFWMSRRTTNNLRGSVTVPNLIVAGWYDQEDFYGPLSIYDDQEKGDREDLNYLVVGPWNHGGWRGEGESYGPYTFGEKTGSWYRSKIELPWFRYWLKNEGEIPLDEALVYQTGEKRWIAHESWPPLEGVRQAKLYLGADGVLSFSPPETGERLSATSFVSDPATPVPYRKMEDIRPFLAEGSTWSIWQADDQASFTSRDDVLVWQTPPLEQDVVVEGRLEASLFASTTGADADWVVKLVDVYPPEPDGDSLLAARHRMVASDVFRARFREGFDDPRPLLSGAILDYRIDLHSASHVFKKGHRIGVHVQSSWFPLISRNPQTYVENILKAQPGDFRSQTHRVYHDAFHPSAVILTVRD